MKQSGCHPKCGGRDVGKRKHFLRSAKGARKVERRCCLSCGFRELWTREEELEPLREERRGDPGGKG